jgi:hypothetical protein
VLQSGQLRRRQMQGLIEWLQAGSHRLAAKVEAGGQLQPMLELL